MTNFIHIEYLKANNFLFLFFAAALLLFSCIQPPIDEDLPPVAAFTADMTSIDEDDMVSFTDESTNIPTSWSWDFGDGETSSDQHPSHTYTSNGVYTVSLTVSNSAGSDTETKTNFITVLVTIIPPDAAFTVDTTAINETESVTFTDLSTNSPTSWSWDFGDEATSPDQHPSHTYTSHGVYTVSLTVSNASGSDTETKTNYIAVTETITPVAAFTVDRTAINENESVTFTDQSTNSPTSWFWNFGDSDTSPDQHPTHTYTSTGNYTVSLTVSNSAGSDSEVKTGYISVSEVVVDVDGNIYDVVEIGGQVWMAENLKTTRYADGTSLQLANSLNEWSDLTNDLVYTYCWTREFDASLGQVYGAQYDWVTTIRGMYGSTSNPSGVQGVCPDGWHVPSLAEWEELEISLGSNPGGKLKEVGYEHWDYPNEGATDEHGFTALPAASVHGNNELGGHAVFWTTSPDPWGVEQGGAFLYYDHAEITIGSYLHNDGLSVRCVKD